MEYSQQITFKAFEIRGYLQGMRCVALQRNTALANADFMQDADFGNLMNLPNF